MRSRSFFIPIVLILLLASGRNIAYKSLSAVLQMPQPVEGEENEKLREKYNALRHKAAPGVIWQDIEAQNALYNRNLLRSRTGSNSFANGALNGSWSEKGATNQTGSIRAIDYVPSANKLYTVSNGGTLWSSVLGSGSWTVLNQSIRFDGKIVKAFDKISGGMRILTSYNNNIYYSDDNGTTMTASTGITFPVAWGGNYISQLVRLNDGSNTVYCLTRPWSSSPWAARYWLYRSTDEGQTFSFVYQFAQGDDNALSLCNPYNSTSLYAIDITSTAGSIKLYSIAGTTVTLSNTFGIGGTNTDCVLKGTVIGGTTTLYTMINNNSMYQSTTLGASWTLKSTFAANTGWNKINVSPSNAALVSYGGVNTYRSANSGATWTLVNDWSAYYGSINNKLHADIMEIEYFKKTDNTEFSIVNCHGGTYVSYDNLTTVSNQSVSSHKAQEYYDVLTDTLHVDRIFCGAQDQGLQGTLTGSQPGSQNFSQIISGDYGHLSLTYNNQFLWPQYPGGTYYFYTNLGNANPTYINSWTYGGSQKSNYGWMLPAKSTADISSNSIWIGGGNTTGGSGSYLAKVTMLPSSPYTISTSQFAYNFRPNSNTGTAGVTAIEQSLLNTNKLYVAMEDGTFFYSNDLGLNWNKTSSFTGPTPWYLYGSCILASRKTNNLVWYTGSGYSNPPVYKSTDGGVTYAPMSNGLPSTLVYEVVASPDEQFLFAATEAGPYVYVTADNTWYSLADVNTPVQNYTNVEYLSAFNIVRFGTMGRGIWDFQIACSGNAITWIGAVSSAWENPANWSCGIVPGPTSDVTIGSGKTVVVTSNPSIATLNLSPGATFTVTTPYKFTLLGH
jgi:hypothetical protein